MPQTTVIWIPDKTLSPAERALLLRILFGPQIRRRRGKTQKTHKESPCGSNLPVQTSAPAAAATAPGLAD